jgi:diguanylate cyclase (GGDEF)-like protein
MPDRDGLLDAVTALAARATGEFDVNDMLRELAASAARILPVAGAGVAYHRDSRMEFVYASTPVLVDIEQTQSDLQQGPCTVAYRDRTTVVEPDLAASRERWPQYVDRALALGLRSSASIPLIARNRVWGALDVYRSTVGPYTAEVLAAADVLASVAVSYVVMAHDRHALLAAEAASAHAATHDRLTGLANRALLYDRLEHALATGRRRGTPVAVLFLDLDGFKAINDENGHHVGDLVLMEVASRLTASLRAGDTLARLGGDEFVIVCENLAAGPGGAVAGAALTPVLSRVQAALRRPALIDGRAMQLRASIGVAIASDGSQDADALLRQADRSMYEVKRAAEPATTAASAAVIELSARRLELSRRTSDTAGGGDPGAR